MRIIALSINTFRETIRNRVLLNSLFFALGIILLSLVVGEWSIYQQAKVIKDFGLSAMSIFGLLIAVFIGIRLMVQELEQKTLYNIASKPVHRYEIVLGKYVGLSLTLAVNVAIMASVLLGAVFLMEGRLDLSLAPAILLIYIEIMLIVAFALFYSSFVSPTLAAIFTLITYVMGHLSGFLIEYVRIYPDRGFHWLFKVIYYTVPNLERLNLKIRVVEHLELPPHFALLAFLYGLCYMALLLLITILIFQRKDLK
jgi:ABC-type transport system involved in multi-copper enzyme maturation permease subunit